MNNAQLKARSGLTWRRAYYAMLSGKKIKRPSWKGYWAYEKSIAHGDMTIVMHTMEGDTIDIRDTINVPYTFENTVANDWEITDMEDKK